VKALSALRTEKVIVEVGPWHAGKIPRGAFPLSHVKTAHRLGKTWQWCVVQVADEQQHYNLLVAFEPGKRQYWAWLGAKFGADLALIGRLEFHESHEGWHCHWKTGPLVEVARGAVKAPYPKERRRTCEGDAIDVSKADAFGVAFSVFNVSPSTDGALL
jgi:hypothetical protein